MFIFVFSSHSFPWLQEISSICDGDRDRIKIEFR